MKKILLSLLLAAPFLVLAQQQRALKLPANFVLQPGEPISSPIPKMKGDSKSIHAAQTAISVPPAASLRAEKEVGLTVFDQQSNASMSNRINNWSDGKISAVWLQSRSGSDAAGYNDRGTGYNNNFSGDFSAPPADRLESIRTGYPSYCVTSSGEEWIFTHTDLDAATNKYKIRYAHKPSTGTTWTQGEVPITSPAGGLWTRCAVGGDDGNTIHLIYLTTPTGLTGGVLVDGINGTLRYCRSSNGGQSWDIIDASLPGITSDNWIGLPIEGYSISANGNSVAIGIFDRENDVLLCKSTNNGTSWAQPRVVNDFPITKFEFDKGYDPATYNIYYDSTYYPTDWAIFSCDNTGSVLVDYNGKAHVFYASLFMADTSSADDNQFTWWPTYNFGIVYWNEDMDDNGGLVCSRSPDLDGGGTTGNSKNPAPKTYTTGYGDAYCTGPTAGLGDDGRLYVTYTSNHELYWDINGNWFKQPFIGRSAAGDFEQWEDAKPLLNDKTAADPTAIPFQECYFPAMASVVDDKVHVLYQQDYGLGLNIRLTGNQDPEDNSIQYLGFPVDLFTTGTKEASLQTLDLSVSPNPVKELTFLKYTAPNNGAALVEVFDLLGKRVHQMRVAQSVGEQTITLPVGQLTNGTYLVRVSEGKNFGIVKMVKL